MDDATKAALSEALLTHTENRIAELESKLAEVARERDEWQQLRNFEQSMMGGQQLAAALAREQQLREDLKETVEALGLLSFHCDGITHTQAPQRTIYNSTYEVYRRQQAALAPKPEDGPLRELIARERKKAFTECETAIAAQPVLSTLVHQYSALFVQELLLSVVRKLKADELSKEGK